MPLAIIQDEIVYAGDINMQDHDGRSALMSASYNGHTEMAALLLEKGAHIDMQDNDGCSALMLASYIGHSEVAALLLEKGAHIDMQDNRNSCLMLVMTTLLLDILFASSHLTTSDLKRLVEVLSSERTITDPLYQVVVSLLTSCYILLRSSQCLLFRLENMLAKSIQIYVSA